MTAGGDRPHVHVRIGTPSPEQCNPQNTDPAVVRRVYRFGFHTIPLTLMLSLHSAVREAIPALPVPPLCIPSPASPRCPYVYCTRGH